MSAPWMPPLPAPDYVQEIPPRFYKDERSVQFFYTADQMRQAQADAARAALEHLTSVVAAALDRPKPIDVLSLARIYRHAIEQIAKEITP